MKTLNFEQMEQVNGGSWWSILNPVPTNGCEFALGRVANVYGLVASVFLSPVGGILVGYLIGVGANAVCKLGMS